MDKKDKKQGETWAGAVKAIALRSLSTGKFWQFCFMVVIVVLVYKMESGDIVKIFELFSAAYALNLLGWILWILTVCATVLFFRIMRKFYLDEIERISKERNELQKKLLDGAIQASKYKPK